MQGFLCTILSIIEQLYTLAAVLDDENLVVCASAKLTSKFLDSEIIGEPFYKLFFKRYR